MYLDAVQSFSSLFLPRSLAFDSHGNLFANDEATHRVVKFLIDNSACPSKGEFLRQLIFHKGSLSLV
jgi:hypothetical protein